MADIKYKNPAPKGIRFNQSPQYPTKKGIWSKKRRTEDSYKNVRLGFPYQKAINNFRAAIDGRDDFDPAAVFVWGAMQSLGVLNILKAVEKKYGEEGQKIVRSAIKEAGADATNQMLDNSYFPDGLEDIEIASYAITGMNVILYASLENPWITSKDRCEFEILWCPQQDIFSAFDCRVQRYFVEGMVEVLEKRYDAKVTAILTKLIPRGADRCHFIIDRRDDNGKEHPWHAYSTELGRRALKKADRE